MLSKLAIFLLSTVLLGTFKMASDDITKADDVHLQLAQAVRVKSVIHISHVNPTTVVVTCVNGVKPELIPSQAIVIVSCAQ